MIYSIRPKGLILLYADIQTAFEETKKNSQSEDEVAGFDLWIQFFEEQAGLLPCTI